MDDFDRDIRNAFHARQLPGAPVNLLRTLDDLPVRHARPVLGSFRLVLGLAAVLGVLLLAVVAVAGGSPKVPPVTSPAPSLPALNGPSTEPSASTAPSSSVEPSVPPTPAPSNPNPNPPYPVPAANSGPAALIDPEHGWAVGDQRLLLTADGGSTWRDATPPAAQEGTTPANLLAVKFVDPAHGWVAFAEPFKLGTDPGFGRVDVWRTSDGGQTWAKTELPPAVLHNQGDTLGDVGFDFLDLSHGYAYITGGSATEAHDSDLYWTADGGQTWSADRPSGSGSDGVEGTVAFGSASDGVIVGGPEGSGVSFTRDGGKTWARAELSAPSGMSGDLRVFGRPVWFDPQEALVPVMFQAAGGNVTRIYRTLDVGATWSFVTHIPGTGVLAVSIVDQRRWIATDGSDVVHMTNGATSWIHVTSKPTIKGLQDARFVDLENGWAEWTDPLGTAHIVGTTDGGATWHALAP
jgi:photosystem II stability/assembly factor-like uncharacterized protein